MRERGAGQVIVQVSEADGWEWQTVKSLQNKNTLHLMLCLLFEVETVRCNVEVYSLCL